MKVFRKLILFGLLFILSINLYSQTSLKAKKLLDDVSLKMSNYNNYEFTFKYMLENSQENIRQESNGKIFVSGSKYRLTTTDVSQLFDGKDLYTIIPENEEVLITSPDQNDDIIVNPTTLIEVYKSGYDFHWDILQNVRGDNIQYIKLIPSEESLDIKYILLGINLKTKNRYRLIEIGRQRTTTTLTIENFIVNKKIPIEFFYFNKADYPEYYIN